jgi:hypothetical protein
MSGEPDVTSLLETKLLKAAYRKLLSLGRFFYNLDQDSRQWSLRV